MCVSANSFLNMVQQDTTAEHYKAFTDFLLRQKSILNLPNLVQHRFESTKNGSIIYLFLYLFINSEYWTLYCKSGMASADSFVVSPDRGDLFMPLMVCAASLKACATNHRDCTAFDRVSHYKALTLAYF